MSTYPCVDSPVVGSRVRYPVSTTPCAATGPRGPARLIASANAQLRTALFGIVLTAASLRSAKDGSTPR